MIDPDSLPSPRDPLEDHADFIELSALKSSNRLLAVREYVRDLELACVEEVSADAEDGVRDEEISSEGEALADDAFGEIDDRKKACGARYPFDIGDASLMLRTDTERSLYVFLALLSWYGKDAGPVDADGEKLFEEICAKAAEGYLGGPHARQFDGFWLPEAGRTERVPSRTRQALLRVAGGQGAPQGERETTPRKGREVRRCGMEGF